MWFIIQGIVQNTTCRVWFRIQDIIQRFPGYYSAYGSLFRVLFKIRPAASGFRFDALTELEAFIRTEFLCVSVLRVASGPRVKLASCKSASKSPVVYSTDRSKAVVPVLVLLFVTLWFILRGDLLYVFPYVIFFLVFFSPFSIAITSLGEERANLSAFRTFVRFVLVWICRFPLPLGVWKGLRFVIVALPGLFS